MVQHDKNRHGDYPAARKLFGHWRCFIAPLAGTVIVCLISMAQKLRLGGELPYHLAGYLVPSLVGWVAGSLVSVGAWRARELMRRISHASMALNRQHVHYEHVLNSVGEGICEFDADGLCLYANRKACRMLAYSSFEIVGKNIFNLFRYHNSYGQEVTLERLWTQRDHCHHYQEAIYEEILWQRGDEVISTDICIYPSLDVNEGGILVFRDTTLRQEMQSKIDFLESCDPLTQLNNKKTFMAELVNTIDLSYSQCENHALFLVDIDRFQTLYDVLGSYASDQLLIQYAHFLKDKVRESDVVARIGGDRFAILKMFCDEPQARSFAQELVSASETFESSWQNQHGKLTVSVGVNIIGASGESVDEVFLGAEKACGLAKEEGRSRFNVYDPQASVYRNLNRQIRALPYIRDALKNDLFFLRRQTISPIEAVETSLHSYEVLLSMQLADGSSLSPDDFLSAAERYDLMPAIDRWVIDHCFAWLEQEPRRWQDLDFMAINLSGKSFNDSTFLAYLEEKLQDVTFPPGKICFEITETAAVENERRSIAFIHRIKQYGCRFALDDFGSGMSSFRYLKNFPVDFIKIDGNFIVDMVDNAMSREIVTSIHNIAATLALKTIAEHAEDEKTLHLLQEIGVDFVQGYVIDTPKVFFSGEAISATHVVNAS
ncbi:MAG: hypothetical protein C0620_13695 [Desulfuromonas sp.]|nr:MAG: hypothetical protein C0620_13695 [Desulfuromonas sp.]